MPGLTSWHDHQRINFEYSLNEFTHFRNDFSDCETSYIRLFRSAYSDLGFDVKNAMLYLKRILYLHWKKKENYVWKEYKRHLYKSIKRKTKWKNNFQSTYAVMKIPHLPRMEFLRKIGKLSTTKNRTVSAYIYVNIRTRTRTLIMLPGDDTSGIPGSAPSSLANA